MIVAIDGPCGTGKSSVAQEVAKRLGFLYFDTGALYRLFAYFLTKKNITCDDEKQIILAFDYFDFDIQKTNDEYFYFLEGEDVSLVIRQQKIAELASKISKNSMVREKLLPLQRIFGKKESIVMEGRDIGSVVFPNAEVKIFLTADEGVRATRRFDQLKAKFPFHHYDYAVVLKELKQRDCQDQNREVAPLKQALDAILIDTSNLSLEQVIQEIIGIVDQKKK